MSWTRHEPEELGGGVKKVEHLRDEEQHHCFTEVTQNADYSKSHPSKITEGVSYKHSGGVPRDGRESAKENYSSYT